MSRVLCGFCLVALVSAFVVQAEDAKPVAAVLKAGSLAETTAVLSRPAGLTERFDGSLAELFERLETIHSVTFRLDPQIFNNTNGIADAYEFKIQLKFVARLSVRDVLEEALVLLDREQRGKLGITAKAGQIILGDAFQMPSAPGGYKRADGAAMMISEDRIARMLYGPTVDLAVQEKTLEEIVTLLREQSGANIAIDPTILEHARKPMTLTMSDVKLLTLLKVVCNAGEIGVAVVDNVYVITTAERAASLMEETEKNLFGGR